MLTTREHDFVDYSALTPEGRVSIQLAALATDATLRTHAVPCALGTYCSGGGVPRLCAAGRYAASIGNGDAACDGLCDAGYWCTAGSVARFQNVCGNESYVCGGGSPMPLRVSDGYYSTGGIVDASLPRALTCDVIFTTEDRPWATVMRPEDATSDCVDEGADGQRADWPAVHVQRHGIVPDVVVSTPCSRPRGLLQPPFTVPFDRWRHCVGGELGDAATRSRQVACEPGTFCWYGLRFLCPPGTYGDGVGETRQDCAGACARGYYCAWGSSNSTAAACGGPHVFCPLGSSAPVPVDVGYYTDPTDPPATRSRQLPCEPGYWCAGGIRTPCPAGTYNEMRGLAARSGCLDCPAGFYCPNVGTPSPADLPCGITAGAAVYCRPGSSVPTPVTRGYYTLGGYDHTLNRPENTTRVTQAPCGPGTYCTGGIAYQCPAGTFGAVGQLASPDCSGPCAPGHFCPPGSISATQYRCGDVFVMLGDVVPLLSLPVNQSNPFVDFVNPAGPMIVGSFDSMALAALFDSLAGAGAGRGLSGRAALDAAAYTAANVPRDGAAAGGGTTLPASATYQCSLLTGDQIATATATLVRRGTSLGLTVNNVTLPPLPRLAECALLYPMPYANLSAGSNATSSLSSGGSSGGASSGGLSTNVSVFVEVSINWSSGVCIKHPVMAVVVDSLAALHRTLLQGGPSGVYCPSGTGFPLDVPYGYVSVPAPPPPLTVNATLNGTSAANATMAAAAASLAARWNLTQASIVQAPVGWYAIAGIVHPCPPGSYGESEGLADATCSGVCPAGTFCPEGTPWPLPCAPGTYSIAASEACMPCPLGSPAAAAVRTLHVDDVLSDERPAPPCTHARDCCFAPVVGLPVDAATSGSGSTITCSGTAAAHASDNDGYEDADEWL